MGSFDIEQAPDIQGNQNITPFTQPISVGSGEGKALANLLEGGTDIVEKEVYTSNKKDLESVFRNISKLRQAADSGHISFSEARSRASVAVKKASAGMPWRAADFRKAGSDFFGAYGEGWGDLNKDSASEKDLLDAKLKKDLVSFYGKTEFTEAEVNNYQVHLQIENQAAQAKNLQSTGSISKDNVLSNVETMMRPAVTGTVFELSKMFEGTKIQGKTPAEMRAEGMTDQQIVDRLSKDQVSLDSLADSTLSMLTIKKQRILAEYDATLSQVNSQSGFAYGSSEIKARKEDLVADINSLITDIKTSNDRSALTRFVGAMQTANKGSLASFNSANQAFYIAKQTGMITDDIVSQYTLDRKLVKNETARRILDKVFKSVDAASLRTSWSNVLITPDDYPALKRSDPDKARVHFMTVKSIMPKLLGNGFHGDEEDQVKQKQFFASASKIYLYQTDQDNPTSINAFEELFFDADYIKLYKQLDPNKQEEIKSPIRERLSRSLFNESGTGIISQIKDNTDFTGIDSVSLDDEGKVSINFTIHPTGKGIDPISVRDTKSKDVETLNKYIQMYIALSPKGTDVESFKSSLVTKIGSILGAKVKTQIKEGTKEND